MSERGISREDLVAALQDIRLPAEAPGGQWADLAAAIGTGLLAALALSLLLPLFTAKRRSAPRPASPQERMQALANLPEDLRAIGLLHLLKELDPEAAKTFTGTIYQKGALPEVGHLEARIKGLRHA